MNPTQIEDLNQMNAMMLRKIEVMLHKIEDLTQTNVIILHKIEDLTKRFNQFEEHRLVAHQPPHLPLQHIAERPKAFSPIPEPDLGNKRPKRARK